MLTKNNSTRAVFLAVFIISLVLAVPYTLASDLDMNEAVAPWHEPPPPANSPTYETDVDNGDGTWTFTQQVDEASTPPNYYGPWSGGLGYGFEIYSWYNGDYGWLHTFPHWNMLDLNVISATLTIHAWDIDSEPEHGYYGEYDGVHVDGVLLSPGYLQGHNDTWSTTVFDLSLSSIVDDGDLNVFLDIDMHHDYYNWATTLDYSRLEIIYSVGVINQSPYQPELFSDYEINEDCITGEECFVFGQDLVIDVIGPVPPDPDGDVVTYEYRWFVDIGTGGFIDDEFAGRGDHTGNIVPAADILPNDIWQVQVIPVDEHGAIGDLSIFTYPEVCTQDCPIVTIDVLIVPGTWNCLWADDPRGTVRAIFYGFPGGYTNTDINAGTVLLNDAVPAVAGAMMMRPWYPGTTGPVAIGGFMRQAAVLSLDNFDNGSHTCLFTGEFNDGQQFQAETSINLMCIGFIISAKGTIGQGIPEYYTVSQNFPNPFNAQTTINYGLPEPAHVTLEIFDMLGRKVTTLVNSEQSAGYHSVTWNASEASSGMYFYKIQADEFLEMKKMSLLK